MDADSGVQVRLGDWLKGSRQQRLDGGSMVAPAAGTPLPCSTFSTAACHHCILQVKYRRRRQVRVLSARAACSAAAGSDQQQAAAWRCGLPGQAACDRSLINIVRQC